MAICDSLPGVQVEILVDDSPLKEYEDSDLKDEPRTSTYYVEATSGKRFAVLVQVLPNFSYKGDCLWVDILVDGQKVSVGTSKGTTRWLNEGPNRTEADHVLKYCFTALEIVSDGHQKAGEKARIKDLGSIVIKCRHMKQGKRYSRVVKPSSPSGPVKTAGAVTATSGIDNTGPGTISEKALKGESTSHSVSFVRTTATTPGLTARPAGKSAPKATARRTNPSMKKTWFCYVNPVPGQPEPTATFVFRYRSMDALKSMLIIPRTPSPPPLEERDFTTLNHDELKQLQKRMIELKKQQESQVKVKQEQNDIDPRPRKVSRPNAGDTQMEIDDTGSFREGSTSSFPAAAKVVIELD